MARKAYLGASSGVDGNDPNVAKMVVDLKRSAKDDQVKQRALSK